MKHILLFILLLKMTNGFSQLQKYYGGCGNDHSKNMMFTNNGVNILGTSNSFAWGAGDIYFIRLDTSGNTTWAKTYRIDHNDEYPTDIINWSANMNIIFGNSHGLHSYFMAIDSLGQYLWGKQNLWGAQNQNLFRMRHAIKSKSNELVACGDAIIMSTTGAIPPAIVTFDSLGTPISSRYFLFSPKDPGTGEGFYTNKIIQDQDSNYVMSGSGFAHTPGQPGWTVHKVLFILKLDKNKNILWTKVFDYGSIFVSGLINSANNSYVLAGSTYNNAFVMKLDSSGNIMFLKELPFKTWVSDFIETTDNKFLLLTERSKLIKLDNQANVIWSYQYDSLMVGYPDGALKISEFNNNYFLLKTSITNSASVAYSPPNYGKDILVIKIDTSGNSNFKQVIPNISATNTTASIFNYTFTPKDTLAIYTPVAFSQQTVSSTFSSSGACLGVGLKKTETGNESLSIFPNPNDGTFNIKITDSQSPLKIEIINVVGSVVQSVDVGESDSYRMKDFQIKLPENQKGLFIVKISYSNDIHVFKKVNCYK